MNDVGVTSSAPIPTVSSAADNPVATSDQDRIGRLGVANDFAKRVLTIDASEGLVVGVLGPWGSGKTSFINLMRPELERRGAKILDFNPWMFSGAEQLVDFFFSELSAQLRFKAGLDEVGKRLEAYGELFSSMSWIPVVGPYIGHGHDLAKFAGGILQRKKKGLAGQREKVHEALRALSHPIIVVLDDIDRLSTPEIRDIFRLVRLTASFPNVIYVLAFDRMRVEDALTEHGISGRAYLEKILQVGFDLPSVPNGILITQILESLAAELHELPASVAPDPTTWPDVFMEIIRPLISNMRDVRRYATAVGGTVASIGSQIALADVLGLEAIRVFLPDVFQRLPGAVTALTTQSDGPLGSGSSQSPLKAEIHALIDSAGTKSAVVKAAIERLFTAAFRHIGGANYIGQEWSHRWLRDRRVAHADILRLYLERVAGNDLLAFNQAEIAWERMSSPEALAAHLGSLEPNLIIETISSLEAFTHDADPQHVLSGCVTLLNVLPALPERERGLFDLGNNIAVTRVVCRLLRSLDNMDRVESVVRAAIPLLNTAFAKLTLVQIVGHRPGIGLELVSENTANELAHTWRTEFCSKDADSLACEPELLQSYLAANTQRLPGDSAATVPPDVSVTRNILLSAKRESRSQTLGTRSVTKSVRLAWKELVEIYGGDAVLRQRLEELRKANFPECLELIRLADLYLSGAEPGDID